jgi:ankyrin repeat protein
MSSLQDEDAQRLASSGYYGFQDYAVEYGHYHTELSATKAFRISKQLRVDICNSIICFLDYYGVQQAEDAEKLDRFHEEIPDLQELMSKWRAGRAETLSILESRTASIRQTIESLGAESENNPDKRPYLELEGMLRFKCPKIHCHAFAVGFEKQDERDDHVKEHERPFKCHEQDCYGRIIGFSSHAHLETHRLRYHTDNIPLGPVFAVRQLKGAPKFYSACSSGNLEAVKISMSSTADLKRSQLSHGLAYAVRQGHIHVCKYLIESGIAVNVIAQKSSPITEAIRKRDWDLALWLWHTAGLPLDKLTSPSPHYYTCIAQALQSGACDILDYLLLGKSISDLRKYVKPVLKEIFFSAIINDMGSQPTKEHTSLMHSWFKRAYPALYTTDNPTSLLCCQPKYQQAEHQELDDDKWHSVLIDQRMSSLESTPLHLASLFGILAPVNFLLDLLGPNDLQITNKEGATPLHKFIVNSKATDGPARADIARRIIQIDGGTSANTNDNDGNIPLLVVCRTEHCKDVFDVLVDSTLDLNVRNKFDHSSLEVAVIHNIPEYVTKLLATGRVDVWRRNKSGQTVFSLAAQRYAIKRNILELLYAADPSLAVRADTSPQRLTPLHHVLMHAPQSLLGLEAEKAEKTKYLLSLPEVDTLLLEYFNADVPDKLEQWDRLYQFASLHGLVDALAALTMYKAGMIAA